MLTRAELYILKWLWSENPPGELQAAFGMEA